MTKEQKLLIDSMIDDVTSYLIEDTKLSIVDALDIVYHSQLYDKLTHLCGPGQAPGRPPGHLLAISPARML